VRPFRQFSRSSSSHLTRWVSDDRHGATGRSIRRRTAALRGPLDLLLTLIRDEQVDIYDIPIARIAEQFLARIQTLAIDQAAEYLEMAARLLRIKAQLLLPRNQDDETWEDPRAELVRRLLEYQQVREISDHLARMAEERRSRFARAWLPSQSIEPLPATLSLSLGELLAAVDRVLRFAGEPHLHDVVPRPLDVDGAIRTIRSLLELRARARGTMSSVLRRSRGKCCRHCSRSLNWPGAASCASVRPLPSALW
jgi:segregation and condensation protein A